MRHHAQCYHFRQMNEIESTDLYIVLETPQSGAIEYLINGMEDSIDKALSTFLIPKISKRIKRFK